MTKMISWNVNGIRACMKKGFIDYFNKMDADVFCIQESKINEGILELELKGYNQYWNYADRKGYSGTAIFTKTKPISVVNGIGIDQHDHEGRVITVEFSDNYLVNVYTPNSGRDLDRLQYRMKWEDDFLEYLRKLDLHKPVIVCGDLNVAHREIDLKNPNSNRKSAGFTDEERGKFSNLLENGFVDTYRYFYPDKEDAYTWWSYMFKSRERNAGWRIDYFCVSKRLVDKIIEAQIHNEILGSDHCPITLEINL